MTFFRHIKLLTACLAALSSTVTANNDGRDIRGITLPARKVTVQKNCSHPILETKGGITRNLGISRPDGFRTVWTWSLDSDGSLSWQDLGSDVGWQTYNSSKFISAPAVLNVLSSSQDLRAAFSIQAGTGHLMYLVYFDGKWEDEWHDLGGRFVYRPAPVSGTYGLSGIFGVNDKGELLYSALENEYFLPLEWTDWTVMGTGFTGEVSVASATRADWEVVGLVNGTYKHGHTDYGGSPVVWTDLGRPPHSIKLGWPKIIALPKLTGGDTRRGPMDVVVVADGVTWHRYYDGASWAEEWTRLPPSHDGLEIMNSQELLVGFPHSVQPILPANGYLFSRGLDNCLYQNQFAQLGYNETTGQTYHDWVGWNNLWCPTNDDDTSTRTRRSPLAIAAIAQYDNRFDFVVETPSGTLEHTQVYQYNGTFGGVVPEWVALEAQP